MIHPAIVHSQRPSPPRIRTFHRTSSVFFVTAALFVLPQYASAQFGGLMQKARDKVVQQATDDGTATAPGQALDEPLLARLLIGFWAADPSLATRDNLQA
jgi:hypothetical protein